MGSSKRKIISVAAFFVAQSAHASDHLDTPSVIADSRADIGDVYAWMSPDGQRLNLAMTMVGHSFSDHLNYAFHLDSAPSLRGPAVSVTISCMTVGSKFSCFTGKEIVTASIGDPTGGYSGTRRLRAFAGLRDDPFFNNVRGTRDMYNAATTALQADVRYDPAGCPMFTEAVASHLLQRWRATDGGPAKNFLNGWASASIVLSVDKSLATTGGPLVGVWGTTSNTKGQVDRAARPLTGNALLATLGSKQDADNLKEKYNRATPADGAEFVSEIARGVALYDGLDGKCGDSMFAARRQQTPKRYYRLARLLADDRLWVDSRYGRCTSLFAVERAALNKEAALRRDCGGRAPTYDASNVYRSLLVNGTRTAIDDGLHADEVAPSDTDFPFLALVQDSK